MTLLNRTKTGVLVGLVLVAACVTPQIPLPPPSPEIFSLSEVDVDQDVVYVEGKANDQTRDAIVSIYNERAGRGVMVAAEPDGSFAADPVAVVDGDLLTVDYRRGEDSSDPTCLIVDYSTGRLGRCP